MGAVANSNFLAARRGWQNSTAWAALWTQKFIHKALILHLSNAWVRGILGLSKDFLSSQDFQKTFSFAFSILKRFLFFVLFVCPPEWVYSNIWRDILRHSESAAARNIMQSVGFSCLVTKIESVLSQIPKSFAMWRTKWCQFWLLRPQFRKTFALASKQNE